MTLWNDDLTIDCKVNPPFSFANDFLTNGNKYMQSLVLKPDSVETLTIRFDIPDIKSRLTKIYNDFIEVKFTGHTVKVMPYWLNYYFFILHCNSETGNLAVIRSNTTHLYKNKNIPDILVRLHSLTIMILCNLC